MAHIIGHLLQRIPAQASRINSVGRQQTTLFRRFSFSSSSAASNEAATQEKPEQNMLSFREALNQALDEEMARDERVFMIGEEVGQVGGQFQVSAGLMNKYGSQRVVDTPITEMGFAGLAVGAAYDGLRPICEFMNVAFALQAIDHIVNSAAKMCYMSAGKINVPIVFRGPNGIAPGVAAQHCQDFSSWYAQCPGLKVLSPANSVDAKGLLKAAIRDENPVVFPENEFLYSRKFPMPEMSKDGEGELVLPIGRANVEREGADITIVAHSNAVNHSMEAAQELAKECGIQAEVINLRTLRPLDFDTVAHSIRKTRRCVTVETGSPVCGIGAEIAARVFEEGLADSLLCPFNRITGVDAPIPYNATLEAMSVPSPKIVANQVKQMMGIEKTTK